MASLDQNISAYRYLKGKMDELNKNATAAGGLEAQYSVGKGGKTFGDAISQLQGKLSPLEGLLKSSGIDLSTLSGQVYKMASAEKTAADAARGKDTSLYVNQEAGGQSLINEKQAGLFTPEQAAKFQELQPKPVTATPTPVDNVVDAEEFVNEPNDVTVGATPNLQVGKASPIFVSGQDLYYIPAGGNQPVKISGPSELQNLASAGMIEVGGKRLPLDQAGTFLGGQTEAAPGAAGAGFLETVGGGTVTSLTEKMLAETADTDKAVADAQARILSFQPTDLSTFRDQLQTRSKVDDLLDEMASLDSKIAELVGIERRIPETTLAAAQNTEITQAVLDRQRTIELDKLGRALAPLTDLKTVLNADLTRREKLIDDSLELKKEADAFKLQQLGFALDFAVQNRSIDGDRAEAMFNAAVEDFNAKVKAAEDARKEALTAQKDQAKAMADFYEAQGYVIDPVTGELAPTLALAKFRSSGSGSGGSGAGGAATEEVIAAARSVLTGLPISQIPQDLRSAVVNYIESQTRVEGPTFSGMTVAEEAQTALGRLGGNEAVDAAAAAAYAQETPDVTFADLKTLFPAVDDSTLKALTGI